LKKSRLPQFAGAIDSFARPCERLPDRWRSPPKYRHRFLCAWLNHRQCDRLDTTKGRDLPSVSRVIFAGSEIVTAKLEELATANIFQKDERIAMNGFVLSSCDAVRKKSELCAPRRETSIDAPGWYRQNGYRSVFRASPDAN
jgi:hypothetical protein